MPRAHGAPHWPAAVLAETTSGGSAGSAGGSTAAVDESSAPHARLLQTSTLL